MLAKVFVSYDKELLDMTTTAIRIFSLSYIISGFNDMQLSLTIMKGIQTSPDCGFQIISCYIKN